MRCSGSMLIELLIVIAIMTILVVIALPSYRAYTRRAHYTEVIQAAAPYRLGVEECYQTTSDLTQCAAGKNGVPPEVAEGTGVGLIHTIAVKDGVITAVPEEKYGIHVADTYILTPVVQQDQLGWQISGGGVEAGYVHA